MDNSCAKPFSSNSLSVSPRSAMAATWDDLNADMLALRIEESELAAAYKAKVAALRAKIRAKQSQMDRCWKQMERSRGMPAIQDAGAEVAAAPPEPLPRRGRKRVRKAMTDYPEGVCVACWRRKLKLSGGPAHVRDSTCVKCQRRDPLPEV